MKAIHPILTILLIGCLILVAFYASNSQSGSEQSTIGTDSIGRTEYSTCVSTHKVENQHDSIAKQHGI